MPWVSRTIIVPAEHVDIARAACEALAGPGGSGMFSAPLSPTGGAPATHYASAGLIEDGFAALLTDGAALAAVAAAAGLDPAPLLAVLAASDIADLAIEPWDATLARLGLQPIHADA